MDSVMGQKEKMVDDFNKMIEEYNREHKTMQDPVYERLKRIEIEHEQTKLQLKERERVLRECESVNKSEHKKLDNEKNMNELAILEQKKVDDRMLKLADEHKREKESFQQKLMDLEKKIDGKQGLEVEVKQLRGGMEVMKYRTDDDIEAKMNFESFKILLTDKEKELELAILELKKTFDSMLKPTVVL